MSAPPKASPAPRPLTTSTGTGGSSTHSSPRRASTPLGPCLTIARSRPSVRAASRGSGVPERLRVLLAGVLARGPEHRAVVEVEDGEALRVARLEGGEGGGAARLLG